jgi:hypothetical protein
MADSSSLTVAKTVPAHARDATAMLDHFMMRLMFDLERIDVERWKLPRTHNGEPLDLSPGPLSHK